MSLEKEEIQKLIDIRTRVINAYKLLDGRNTPTSAVMKQQDAALIYEIVVRELDTILKKYVNIEK